MTRIETPSFKTEDKTEIIIIVGCNSEYNGIFWCIEDIKYRKYRQRQFRYMSKEFRDLYEYGRLDSDEREEYAYRKYEEFVGKERLQEALMYAWNMIKPNQDNIFARIL